MLRPLRASSTAFSVFGRSSRRAPHTLQHVPAASPVREAMGHGCRGSSVTNTSHHALERAGLPRAEGKSRNPCRRSPEGPRHPADDRRGIVADLPPGHADDQDSPGCEFRVADAVGFEPVPRSVEGESVHLESKTGTPPEEVQFVTADPLVGSRGRRTSASHQFEESRFRLGARERRAPFEVQDLTEQDRARPAR